MEQERGCPQQQGWIVLRFGDSGYHIVPRKRCRRRSCDWCWPHDFAHETTGIAMLPYPIVIERDSEPNLYRRAEAKNAPFLKFTFHNSSKPAVLSTPSLYITSTPLPPIIALNQVSQLIREYGWKRRLFHRWEPFTEDQPEFITASIDSYQYVKDKISEATNEAHNLRIRSPRSVDQIVRRKLAEVGLD